jgi:hypothetical protein
MTTLPCASALECDILAWADQKQKKTKKNKKEKSARCATRAACLAPLLTQ